MADPAPSTPLPDDPESRVGPADQMAALTGEPVEISQPEDDEPAEDRDVSSGQQIDALAAMAPFKTTAPSVKAPRTTRRNARPADPPKLRANADAPTGRRAISPPARAAARPPPDLTAIPPLRGQPLQMPNHRRPLFPESPGPSERGLAKPAGRGPAERGGDGRRSPDRRSPSPRAACPGRSRRGFQGCNFQRRSFQRHASADALPPRSARRQKHPRQPSPARAKGSRASTAPTPGATAAASSAASAPPDAAAAAASPAGGLRDKLGVFTADRMQARRDAEEIKGASQAGTAVLASLEALERQETTGILMKIRDAASANGGIEHVLSEMRPGGAFEDLRKEFNVALSHDEGFAAAYEKATGALSSYAETRAGMISAPRPRADVNLARLETLDQEIGAAAKTLPGLKDGKNALDEALEGGKEAVEKAFTAIRQAFTRDADVRGPSPSPGFGP